ncbi:MAG: polymerase subunit alpha, polymerase subunit alpha protein [Candidatus Adlerbacteria bacterium]|nr:polymerase subunit alpha, polymerase subunit alpha protein [Candidatus Adlerbacteria bacterium]
MSFVPLHVHSHYSLLKALPKVGPLVEAAKAAGCTTLALTDLGNMYGAIEFYKECKDEGIKPILGLDVHVGNEMRLVLLAENVDGYHNLLSLITESNLEGTEDTLTFSKDLLRKYSSNLFAIIPSLRGEVTAALRAREVSRAEHTAQEYIEIFGKDHVYLEVSVYEDTDGHDAVMKSVAEFGKKIGLPIVAGQEIYYINRDDRRAWETMRAIEGKGERAEGDVGSDDEDFSFHSAAEMTDMYAEMPEALENSIKLAERCNLELPLGKWYFPNLELPEGSTPNDELKRLIEEGIVIRKLEDTPELRKRLDYEYKIICDKGYAPYFLVVGDLLRFARENKILTTIRGSVAGSMVTFVIGITNVNPIIYKLPFERFLNPERPSAPDIDMDYADNRRDEMIEYARQKYGRDHVAQIGTFGTMLARGVVRDVARALHYPYGLGDRIAKEIPMGSQGFPMTLERALVENPELGKMYKKEDETREIIDLGRKIEGCARHISVHAAGVVIAPRPLVEFTPLQKDPKGGRIITQYDMYSIDENNAGLLKFDFLGIRNLAILAHSVELVEMTRGVHVDIENVSVEDTKTFEMLARGETEGTFQLNGAGMTRYLKELRPSTIHDINAMVALFRPGPMETIPQYIERKHNPQKISYADPRMKDYLEFSYGCLVYQDDVLLTSINLAGYSWLEADKLRKAMGKKIPEVMEAEKEKLLKGFVEYGKLSKPLAERLWKLIEPFAAYGFNKAHAASYGKVAYQTAYMKANYPVEYMAAVLTAESGDIDTVSIMVNECKRMGIPVLPPDINESFGDFTVILGNGADVPDAIRFGLYSIKHFGSGIAEAIISERKQNGHFTSLSDFLSRVKVQGLNKKGLESLIKCGALDSFVKDRDCRGQMMNGIELMLEFHRDAGREITQDSLFGNLGTGTLELPPAPEATLSDKLMWEKELLGLYVSGHPLDKYKDVLSKRPMTLKEVKERVRPGTTAVAAGMIQDVRMILTRGGDQMAFVKLMDFEDTLEFVVFPKSYVEFKSMLVPENCIALKGQLSTRNGELSMVADKMKVL